MSPAGMAPALLTRISILGQFFTSWSTFLESDRSKTWIIIRTPCFASISFLAFSRSCLVLDTKWRLQPSAANSLAQASPIPFEPPVISTVLLRRFKSILFPLCASYTSLILEFILSLWQVMLL